MADETTTTQEPEQTIEQQEASAAKYMFEMFAGKATEETKPQQKEETAEETSDEKPEGFTADQYRDAQAKIKEMESSLEASKNELSGLSGLTPVQLLKKYGKTADDAIQEHLSDDSGETVTKESMQLEQLVKDNAELKQRLDSKETNEARSRALKDIGGMIKDDTHFWLHNDKQSAEKILGMIESEFNRSGEVLQPSELIEKLEKEQSESAERVLSLHNSRNGSGKPEQVSRPGANLKNTGGSKTQVSFDNLSESEKEEIAAKQMQEIFHSGS